MNRDFFSIRLTREANYSEDYIVSRSISTHLLLWEQ